MTAKRNFTKPAIRLGAAVLCLGLAAGAQAVTFTSITSSPAISIPDGGYDGTPASLTSDTINVGPLAEKLITDVNVKLAISHTYLGDLTVKLLSPSGTLVTLINRAGNFADDVGNQDPGGGDSSDLDVLFPITLDDQAASGVNAENMGNGYNEFAIIGDPGNGSPNNYIPNNGDADLNLFASFNGEDADGVWTLFLGDSSPGGTGRLASWTLEITTEAPPSAVPEVNTGALGALAMTVLGVAMTSRRRLIPAAAPLRA